MQTVTLAPGVSLQKTERGSVLRDEQGGTFMVNKMGSAILSVALGGFSNEGIAHSMRHHFNGSALASERAVTEWLPELELGGLLRSLG